MNNFFYRAPSDHCTFPKIYLMIDSLGVFGSKIDAFHISCVTALFSFITLLGSVFHGYSVLVFIPKALQRRFQHYSQSSETTPELK